MLEQNTIAEPDKYQKFIADPQREEACRILLKQYLTRIGQEPIDLNVDQLFAIEGTGVSSRFNYFVPRMPISTRQRLLVSGCAAGSEMIIARQYGFQEIFGTEVAQDYVDITRERLENQEGFEVLLYDGLKLPFPDNTFSAAVSGHIIEHTRSPFHYLKEHIRVLAAGGFLFLEFPNRYHATELHTGLPSLEHLPWPLRSIGLRYRASRFSRYSEAERKLYQAILRTLRPVSTWQIKLYLFFSGERSRVVHHYSPAPGFVRLLVVKTAS